METIKNLFLNLFENSQIPTEKLHLLYYSTLAILLILIALVIDYITKKVLLAFIDTQIKKTKTNWDDILLKNNTFSFLVHFIPLVFLYYTFPYVLESSEALTTIFFKFIKISSILLGLLVIFNFFRSVNEIYQSYDYSRQRPIKGYIQVLNIILSIIAAISILSIIFEKSLLYFFSGLGAFTVVIMLVFKDSILGLVAGIQLTSNKMIHLGDWVVMSKYGADGDVIEITLNTVKIQNWDKTITTIPTYALVSESFQNYRGMQESGGRRIKRSLHIDMQSIKFCDESLLNKLKNIQHLKQYLESKTDEINQHNRTLGIDKKQTTVNGRSLTNIGIFRKYIELYLRNNKYINQEMTFLIRQLQPDEKGLPIEIYVFSNDTRWVNYEGIQADIFDHLLAAIQEFDLRIYQAPSGYDFRQIN